MSLCVCLFAHSVLLASSWESGDGDSFNFTLRQALLLSLGQPQPSYCWDDTGTLPLWLWSLLLIERALHTSLLYSPATSPIRIPQETVTSGLGTNKCQVGW